MSGAIASIVRELAPGAIPEAGRTVRRLLDVPHPCSLPPVAVHWLVDGMIPAGGITLLTGRGGIGKSFVALDLARAAMAGDSWLCRKVSRVPYAVLLDRENPLSVAQSRLERFSMERAEGLRWVGTWLDWHIEMGGDELMDAARAGALVVVDSLSAHFDGDSENDAVQVRAWFQRLRRLASAGAAVVVIHHSGKGDAGKNYRGSSDVLAAVDAAYLLEADAEGEPMQNLKLTCFKLRAAEEPRAIHLKLGGSCFEVTADPSNDRQRDRLDRLADAIGRHSSGMTAREVDGLAGELKVSRGDIRDGLKRLEIDGRVVKRDGRFVSAGKVLIEV
ncbi:MAG: AAA family ATPase [Acidobacteriota bacterium]